MQGHLYIATASGRNLHQVLWGKNLFRRLNKIYEYCTRAHLHTFDSDLDDVVCAAQAVRGRTAVVAGVSFVHVRNPERFLEVVDGRPAAWQLAPILLPGDTWSGPVIETISNTLILFFLFLQLLHLTTLRMR